MYLFHRIKMPYILHVNIFKSHIVHDVDGMLTGRGIQMLLQLFYNL